jgi:MerR family transcriptional regulator/heat shock protein HspR
LSKEKTIDKTKPIIAIGTLANMLDVSISTIRKYEAEGLLISYRTESGHRLFSLEDVERIKKIQHMIQKLGLNIEGIRRLQAFLPCWNILPCSEKQQKQCPAFLNNTKPCWMITELECSKNKIEKCRNCDVYRFGTLRTEEIKQSSYWNDTKKNLSDLIHARLEDRG